MRRGEEKVRQGGGTWGEGVAMAREGEGSRRVAGGADGKRQKGWQNPLMGGGGGRRKEEGSRKGNRREEELEEYDKSFSMKAQTCPSRSFAAATSALASLMRPAAACSASFCRVAASAASSASSSKASSLSLASSRSAAWNGRGGKEGVQGREWEGRGREGRGGEGRGGSAG